jgi:hypothetical protein
MSSQVTVKLDLSEESLKKAFPTAQGVKLNRFGRSITLEFANAADAKAFETKTTVELPLTQRPQVVTTRPDVTVTAADQSKLVTITDTKTETGGRIYKNTDLQTRHVSSLRFAPVVNSVILPQVDFGSVQIQVISVTVIPETEGRFAVFIRAFHKASGRYGTLVFKRFIDAETGEVKLSRRCFDLLVDQEDYKKENTEIVPVHAISIESITVDPATGLWSELKIALDSVSPQLSLFRMGAQRRFQGGETTRQPFRGGGGGARPFRGGRKPRHFTSRRSPQQKQQQQQQQPQQQQQQPKSE